MFEIVGTPHYISPEVLKRKYNQKCDIWSAGVILYAMLSGTFPFNGKTDKDIYKAILRQKVDFPDKIWKNISKEAKDLISHMLCEEEKRLSAEKILNHHWFNKQSLNKQNKISKENILEIKNYKNSNDFKRFILTCLATRLKENEIKELKKLFCEMDKNKDGTLTFEEIKKCLMKLNSEKEKDDELLKLFEGIDTNNSNKIEYTEFISALIGKKKYLKEEKLLEIFKTLDKDGNGKITKDEIKKVLKGQDIDENDFKQFITKFDLDDDGQIDYYEFISNMNELKIS